MNDLIAPKNRQEIIAADDLKKHYIKAATSVNTRRAYQQDIRHYMQSGGLLPASVASIETYLITYAAKLKPSTLQRKLIALRHWHTYQNFTDPTKSPQIKKLMTGILREHNLPLLKAKTLSLDEITSMVSYLDDIKTGSALRDRALILVGFFGAFRRSELVSMMWEDIDWEKEGIKINIKHSKTDQESKGQVCILPYSSSNLCPVIALKNWQQFANSNSGPIFLRINKSQIASNLALSAQSVNLILKKLAKNLNFKNAEQISGHSLRRGFATLASQKNLPLISIMRHGRWKQERTVHGYIEEVKLFEDNPLNVLLSDKKHDK